MQVVKKGNIEKRLLYYWSKLYISGIRAGENYSNLKRTIVILLADFEFNKLKDIPNIERGIEQRTREIVKNLLNLDIPIDKIVEATNLTKEEIDKIKTE